MDTPIQPDPPTPPEHPAHPEHAVHPEHPNHPEHPGQPDPSSAPPHGGWSAEAAAAAAEAAAAVTDRVTERLHGLGEEIHRKINAVLESLPQRLAAAGLQPEDIEHVRVGIEHAGERVAARIDMKVEQAVARARRVAERGERRARWGGGAAGFGRGPFGPQGPMGPTGPMGPMGGRWSRAVGFGQGAAQPGAATTETLTILRMLGEGKITADEAERLLAAMGRVSQSA